MGTRMIILGISAYYHDSAAALLVNGQIVAAAQEERFTRKKHDASFPFHAIKYCLEFAGITLSDVDHVIFYDKPFLKFERLIETYMSFAPKGYLSFAKAMPIWLKDKLFQKKNLQRELQNLDPDFNKKILFAKHHQSHAASAYYPSPFSEAVVLTMDGVGEWTTTSVALGQGKDLKMLKELHFPHSLGLLYSAFTYHLGFKVNSGEYKVMGLAPYGEPKFKNTILKHLIDIKEDGSFFLNQKYFDYCVGLKMTNDKFSDLFGVPARRAERPLEQIHMDLAASIQAVTEEVIMRLTGFLAQEYNIPNLCLAGGVALNCVANGKVGLQKKFKNIWTQPAAGDAGGALGAALIAYYLFADANRQIVTTGDAMQGSYLGPSFPQAEIERRLAKEGAIFDVFDDEHFLAECVLSLTQEKAVGWFQGRMEFGPRALGCRSILGDARSPKMQSTLNLKIKYRESFRPFAPSILREHVGDWFEWDSDSPYMLFVAPLKDKHCRQMSEEQKNLFGIEKLNVPRSNIPAVTHVDYSARIQTVHESTNQKYYNLLKKFYEKTGCPVLVNTSFNVRGEPIVCTPEDAFRCFMGTEMDVLAIGNCFLRKEKQNAALKKSYLNHFELD